MVRKRVVARAEVLRDAKHELRDGQVVGGVDAGVLGEVEVGAGEQALAVRERHRRLGHVRRRVCGDGLERRVREAMRG